MGNIVELNNVLWVTTPHGIGQVLFLIDYGPHENCIFVVALEQTLQIKHYSTEQVTICKNYTLDL